VNAAGIRHALRVVLLGLALGLLLYVGYLALGMLP
jgi:hypothetical protein